MHVLDATYIFCYLLTVMSLAFASGRVYSPPLDSDGEQEEHIAWRVRRGASYLIASWILSYILYIPIMFLELPVEIEAVVNTLMTFFIILIVSIVSLWSVNEFLQLKTNMWDWMPWVVLPEVGTMVMCAIYPSLLTQNLYFLSVGGVTIYGVCYFYRRYQRYKRLLLEEYSDMTHRELRWVWGVCIVMAIQSLSFVAICIFNTVALEFVGMVVVVICSTFVAKCAFRTEPLSKYLIEDAAVEEHMMEENERMPDPVPQESICSEIAAECTSTTAETEEQQTAEPKKLKCEISESNSEARQKAYDVINHKLKTMCEDEKVFLNPDLTREMLCNLININRTYLSDYLRSKGTTYYNYINSLRIQYAVGILRETPNLPLVDVSYRSGYSNPATFRRAFRDIMGCLPSEYLREETS